MERIELKTTVRPTIGKGAARSLRRAGSVPAVVYGPGIQPILLSVGQRDLENALKNRKRSLVVLDLMIQNGETSHRSAMIKELQTHPVTGAFLHADFYEISMERKIRVRIPVVTTGKSKGVEKGGLLQIVRHEIEILCLPGRIPEKITLDISGLDIGDSIHVREIPIPEDIEIPADVDFTVLTVVGQKVEKPAGEEEEAGAEAEEEGA